MVRAGANGAFVPGGRFGFSSVLCWRAGAGNPLGAIGAMLALLGPASWARTKSRRSTGSINFSCSADRAARTGTDCRRHRSATATGPLVPAAGKLVRRRVDGRTPCGGGRCRFRWNQGSARPGGWPPAGSRSSTSATTTYSNCCIKWRPPVCRRPMSPPRSERCSATSTTCGCCWVK